MNLLKRLQNPHFVDTLRKRGEVAGYESPTTGRVTYSKIVGANSFAAFVNVVMSIIPLDVVYSEERDTIPSIVRVLKDKNVVTYPSYIYMNSAVDEYMDWQNEDDQEELEEFFAFVDQFGLKKPVLAMAVMVDENVQSAHAIAVVAWKASPRKYKFAYYDSLAFKRPNKSFDFAQRAFNSSRFSLKVEFIDLNTYCYQKSENEFHCSQYVMDADYCFLFGLYFLAEWVGNGQKLHRLSFKKAIKATYIVAPSKLTRSNTKESMVYRIMMMSFICKNLLAYLKGLGKKEQNIVRNVDGNIRQIKNYLQAFKENYGFDLI